MPEFTLSGRADAPVEEVWKLLFDPTRSPSGGLVCRPCATTARTVTPCGWRDIPTSRCRSCCVAIAPRGASPSPARSPTSTLFGSSPRTGPAPGSTCTSPCRLRGQPAGRKTRDHHHLAGPAGDPRSGRCEQLKTEAAGLTGRHRSALGRLPSDRPAHEQCEATVRVHTMFPVFGPLLVFRARCEKGSPPVEAVTYGPKRRDVNPRPLVPNCGQAGRWGLFPRVAGHWRALWDGSGQSRCCIPQLYS